MKTFPVILLTGFIFFNSSFAGNLSDFTKDMDKYEGYFNFYYDKKEDRILLNITEFDQQFLYVNYLQSGLGSNDIGLDRGQIGNQRVVQFQRFGNKVMLVEPNLMYRAISDNKMEVKAVEDGFAQSVLMGTKIIAEDNTGILIDITGFLLRDSHDIAGRLSQMKQGNYQIDKDRSALYLENCKSFPKNTEFEALITLQGNNPGNFVRSVTPTPEIISVRTHQSFVQLPDTPYKSRQYDSRSGAISTEFQNYAAPLGEDLTTRLVIRHRLQKKFPEKEISDPIEPIIYYLDSGTPEPVRSALLEGASWWKQAFEAAGFSNAFEVRILPENADPLDIRYNTIQWAHRSTRGWSYGASIIDPRSGEILKGHVTLGSLRVRQDMAIVQGLLSPFKDGINTAPEIEETALARLRQLSAHEVGHTLGLTHNFAASTNQRASVMDYPHPLIQINEQGELDLSKAYDTGIGAWDKVAISYIYSEFNEKEQQHLSQILQKANEDGLAFISDRDARAAAGSHPYAHLWDNGKDPVAELYNVLKIRKIALNHFGLDTIRQGQDLFKLEQLLTPVYLFHRYQTEAVSKLIAGVNYRYALKGEQYPESSLVDGKTQNKAIKALIQTLQADELAVPEHILTLLLPPADASYRNREHFKSRTGLNFDALGVAETSAQNTLEFLLNSQRMNRLVEQHAKDPSIPTVDELLETLIENTWNKSWKDNYLNEVQNSINSVVLHELFKLAADSTTGFQTKSTVNLKLKELAKSLSRKRSAVAQQAEMEIENYFKNGYSETANSVKPMPPGSPIGMH